MLAQQVRISFAFFVNIWRPLFATALIAIVVLTAVRVLDKAQKLGRTGEQSRTAFLRWRPQIQALDHGIDVYHAFNYPNPPIMALILKPLTELPPLTGMLTWFALKVLMAVLMAALIFRMIEASNAMPDWAKALAIALSLHPIHGDLTHGNVNLFIAFLIVAGLHCYRCKRDFRAGLLIALAIACKITPALFVPYFLWKRAWRTLLGISVGLVFWWAVVPGAVLGFDYNRTLITSWFDVMVKPFVLEGQVTSEHANQSLPGLLTRLLTDRPSFVEYAEDDGHPIAAGANTIVILGPTVVAVLVKIAMLAFAGVVVWLARTKDRGGLAFAAECSLIVLGMLLFSERTWKHHATTLLLPVSVVIAAAMAYADRRLWLCVAAIPILSFIPSAFDSDLQNLCMVYGVFTALYMILMLACIRVLSHSRPEISGAASM